jgi:hypothetical protein
VPRVDFTPQDLPEPLSEAEARLAEVQAKWRDRQERDGTGDAVAEVRSLLTASATASSVPVPPSPGASPEPLGAARTSDSLMSGSPSGPSATAAPVAEVLRLGGGRRVLVPELLDAAPAGPLGGTP